MNVQKKLKVYAVLTFLGLVMMTVVFVSPGLSVIEIPVEPPQIFEDRVMDGPIAIDKRSVMEIEDNVYYYKTPRVRVSMGLWYYVVCFHKCGRSHHDGHKEHHRMHKKEHRCHFSTYQKRKELPLEYMSAYDTYSTITDIGREGIIEFQIESALGLACGLLGFIASLLYVRHQAQKRAAGLTACISLIVAGVLYMVVVGKAATALIMYREMYKEAFYEGPYHLRMSCPWGLYVGAASGILILISALGHLCVLSRNSKSDDVHVYHIQKDAISGYPSKISYPTIVPPGYEQHVGLKEALPVTSEEAGPLPEKEQI